MNTKKGVKYNRLKPSLKMAAEVCKNVYKNQGYDFVITSTDDGIHKKGSLHYFGLAFDCRTRHLTENSLGIIYENIKKRLNTIDERFQIILEDTHIHVEFDRRCK